MEEILEIMLMMRTNLKAATTFSSLIVLALLWQLLVQVNQLEQTSLGEDVVFYLFFLVLPLVLVLFIIARNRVAYFLGFIYGLFYLVAGLYAILQLRTLTCCQVPAMVSIVALFVLAIVLAKFSHRSYRGLY